MGCSGSDPGGEKTLFSGNGGGAAGGAAAPPSWMSGGVPANVGATGAVGAGSSGFPSSAGGVAPFGGLPSAGGFANMGGILGGGGFAVGGGPAGTTGAGGISGTGSVPGDGGPTSAGGTPGAGGAPITYPPLDFRSIGSPVSIGNTFLFTEGPVWDPAKQVLFFTDINADTIYRLTLPATFDSFLTPMGKSDGLGLDPQGNLIGAGFASRDVWRLVGGSKQSIASSYQGKRLNSPDDLCARSDGIVYFTDPVFGINGSQGLPAQTQEQPAQGVYRITTDGVVHLEDQATNDPNGVEFSPDEKTLYVSYTTAGRVDSFSVALDGALSGRKTFAGNVPLADSMCVDAGGDVYVAILGGIAVHSPSGIRLGTISMSQVPTNCTFGGPDMKTFFITARTGLLGTPTRGNSSIYRIDNMPIPGIPGR